MADQTRSTTPTQEQTQHADWCSQIGRPCECHLKGWKPMPIPTAPTGTDERIAAIRERFEKWMVEQNPDMPLARWDDADNQPFDYVNAFTETAWEGYRSAALASAQAEQPSAVESLVLALQEHAKEQGWQDVDDPIAALLAWKPEAPNV